LTFWSGGAAAFPPSLRDLESHHPASLRGRESRRTPDDIEQA
jgi:hypothetical protein